MSNTNRKIIKVTKKDIEEYEEIYIVIRGLGKGDSKEAAAAVVATPAENGTKKSAHSSDAGATSAPKKGTKRPADVVEDRGDSRPKSKIPNALQLYIDSVAATMTEDEAREEYKTNKTIRQEFADKREEMEKNVKSDIEEWETHNPNAAKALKQRMASLQEAKKNKREEAE